MAAEDTVLPLTTSTGENSEPLCRPPWQPRIRINLVPLPFQSDRLVRKL